MRYPVYLSILVLAGCLLGCGADEPEAPPPPYDEYGMPLGDRADADAALDTARAVAADSALAYGAPPPAAPERVWPDPDSLNYRAYRNEEYGYAFEYPDNLLQWGDAIGEDRGQSFETADGSAELLVYAFEGKGEDALRSLYEGELAREDQRVTYQTLRPTWFVISGYDGPHIFYQRTFRSADGYRTFRLRHLARDGSYFGPITERLSYSFRPLGRG